MKPVFNCTYCAILVPWITGEGGVDMKSTEYDRVCYWTEQRDENVPLRNLRTGEVGYSFGCTIEGSTIQVRLANGEFDSWEKRDCAALTETVH